MSYRFHVTNTWKDDEGGLGTYRDDEMIFKTNENLGGICLYSLDHITDGRFTIAVWQLDGQWIENFCSWFWRTFLVQETWAIRRLMLKLNDHGVVVQRRAMDEILACLIFIWVSSRQGEKFLKNPSNQLFCETQSDRLLKKVSISFKPSLFDFETLLSHTNIEECVRRTERTV